MKNTPKDKLVIPMEWPTISTVAGQYYYVMDKESSISKSYWDYPKVNEIYGVARQILSVAGLSLVPRSFNGRYNDFHETHTMESVSAHTNLVIAIVLRFLRYQYWSQFEHTKDNYNLMEIIEVIQRHDQPELETGDLPDNGEIDQPKKLRQEKLFHRDFARFSPSRDETLEYRVQKLIEEMDHQSSSTGRLLYVADKISAIIITLVYDKLGLPLMLRLDDESASKRDLEEMILCDRTVNGACYASEMWSIDYFKKRDLAQYDDTGYFTALLVMCTLLVNDGQWYTWREADYH